jgi:hypothetical protein
MVIRSRVSEEDRRDSLRLYSEIDFSVLGLVDNTHATFAELFEDRIVGHSVADESGHDNSYSGGRVKKASAHLYRRISDSLRRSRCSQDQSDQ